jgi:hypothetical protein
VYCVRLVLPSLHYTISPSTKVNKKAALPTHTTCTWARGLAVLLPS